MDKNRSSREDRSSDKFLEDLRAFESGISIDKHGWYVDHLDVPVLHYPAVTAPGRVVRDDKTGSHRLVPMTIAQYFSALGVYDLFDEHDASCLRRMQYHSINAWGYVGYQFGEECLSDVGYYEAQTRTVALGSGRIQVPRFHRGGLDPRTWSGGRTELLLEDEGVIVTDVNRWEGRFTGKNGVRSFADLLKPEIQETIIRETAASNLRQLISSLDEAAVELGDCLEREWMWEGQPVRCSLSGIIASCHLLGPKATAKFLESAHVAYDDLGTSVLDYMARFGSYATTGVIDLPALLRERG